MTTFNNPKQVEESLNLEVGKRLRHYRKVADLSMEDVAEKLGITYQQLQKIERGYNRISVGRLMMICEVLNINVHRIVGDDVVHTGMTKAQIDLVKATNDKSDNNVKKLTEVAKVMK